MKITVFQSTPQTHFGKDTHLSGLRTPFQSITFLQFGFCPPHFGPLHPPVMGEAVPTPQTSAPTPRKTGTNAKRSGRCSCRSIPPQQREPFGSKYKPPTINSLFLQVCTQGAASSRMWQGQRLICFFFVTKGKRKCQRGTRLKHFPHTGLVPSFDKSRTVIPAVF